MGQRTGSYFGGSKFPPSSARCLSDLAHFHLSTCTPPKLYLTCTVQCTPPKLYPENTPPKLHLTCIKFKLYLSCTQPKQYLISFLHLSQHYICIIWIQDMKSSSPSTGYTYTAVVGHLMNVFQLSRINCNTNQIVYYPTVIHSTCPVLQSSYLVLLVHTTQYHLCAKPYIPFISIACNVLPDHFH